MRPTKKIKDQLLDRAEGKCEYCGDELYEATATVSHIVPIKDGGLSDIDNLSISCAKCNFLKADKIIGSISNPVVESAAKLWVHAYIKNPVITAVFSIIVGFAATFFVYHAEEQRKQRVESELAKNQDFKSQIDQLDETEKNLKALLNFVSVQRESATQNEQRIKQLEQEKQKLEPLVNADKATVEALFKVQEERALSNASKEKWIGFGLGILASIIASFVMVIGKYFLIARKESS
ncbi:HNH endonuclease [Rheinheimera faecalis]